MIEVHTHALKPRVEQRLWVFFWVKRYRFFCIVCNARGLWRKSALIANEDGAYHRDIEALKDLMDRMHGKT